MANSVRTEKELLVKTVWAAERLGDDIAELYSLISLPSLQKLRTLIEHAHFPTVSIRL